MQNLEIVQFLEASKHIDNEPPNVIFLKEFFLLLIFRYFMVKVSIIGELHHNALSIKNYQRLFPSKKASL